MARVGWLRAAVLGANDGIVSTASPDYSSDGPFWVGERSLTC